MSESFISQVLALVKVRLNRLAADNSLDEYLTVRIRAAFDELDGNGIAIDETSPCDFMLLVDYVVWQYGNRDKPEGMPEWLRERKRDRWLSDSAGGGDCL